jgi:diguanylate cyclase (GGDEF)-like protein
VIDRRLLVAICAALVALASGVFALALDAPALGLVAGTGAVVAAGAAAVLTSRLRLAVPPRAVRLGASEPAVSLDLAALEAQAVHGADVRDPFDGPPVERPSTSYLAHPSRGAAAEFGVKPAEASDDETDQTPKPVPTVSGATPTPATTAPGEPGDTVGALAGQANDPVSGLLGAPYFYAALDRGVASARRQLQPLSLVLFDLDGLDSASDEIVDASMEVLGAILRRTLRECDTACRTGHTTAAVLLEDTPETGAVWAAERVRGGLLARPDGDHLTVSAGVASYPSHALDATDLLQRAELALQSARNQGRDRVEIARSAD